MNQLRLLILSSLFIGASNTFAQNVDSSSDSSPHPTYRSLEKGTFTWGFNGSVGKSEDVASGSITPQVGYTLADRLVVGLQFSAANRFTTRTNSFLGLRRGTYREYAFTPELYARYYVLPYRFTPFIQVSSGYTIGEASINHGTVDNIRYVSTNNFVVSGAAGVSMRIGKKMGLQAQYNLPIVVDTKINEILRINRFRLGLSFYLK